MARFILHLRGLPWEADESQIQTFLEIADDHIESIQIMKNSSGKNNGDAYLVCTDEDSAVNALSKHKNVMEGYTRYVEVFKSSEAAMSAGSGATGKGVWDGVVKMRGFTYDHSEEDIKNFCYGLTWMENGITIPLNQRGQCAGEAFIQFEDYENANQALAKNKQELGGRYIECYKSSNNEMRIAIIKSMKAKFGMPQPMGMQQMQMPQQAAWGGLNMGPGGQMGGGQMGGQMGGGPMGGGPMGGFGMKQEVGFGGGRGGFGGRPGPY